MSQQTTMPQSYTCCTTVEGQCPLWEHCLRSRVYRETFSPVMLAPLIETVNFKSPKVNALTEQCTAYRSDRPQRFARGMSHIFDLVPKVKYRAVQQSVQACFGCRHTYFYCKKGEQLISPKEQAAIAQTFSRYGIAEPPRFDSYEECYNWELAPVTAKHKTCRPTVQDL
jgi:hypothetical protein